MLEPMFEVPGSNVKAVHIEAATVRGEETPRYEYHEEECNDNREEGDMDSDEAATQEGTTGGGSSEDVALEQTTAAKAKV